MNKKGKQKLCLLDLLDQVGMCQKLLRIYEPKKKKSYRNPWYLTIPISSNSFMVCYIEGWRAVVSTKL